MSRAIILCIDGVEEIECLTVVDFCRRAGIETVTASMTDDLLIHGMHGIDFFADQFFKDADLSSFDAIVYPGGAGAGALGDVPGSREAAAEFLQGGKLLAAICASPGMLSRDGLIKDRHCTGYPGCTPQGGAIWSDDAAVTDKNLITGRGPGCACDFALEIIKYLEGAEKEMEIRTQTVMPR